MLNPAHRNTLFWTALSIGVWCLLWVAPWQTWLAFSKWLRLGMALLILIVPGFCIYGFLQPKPTSWLNRVTFGFVISHLVMAVLGTVGRLLQLPFTRLEQGMFIGSLVLLALYVPVRLATWQLPRFNVAVLRGLASHLPLILTMLLAGLLTVQRTLSDDDLSYLAYTLNWQNSTALNFNDVFFGADQLTAVRFWIVSSPFSQAFLAKVSGIHPLFLLGGYYEPFLAVLTVGVVYELARTLGMSQRQAIGASLAQVIFLALLSEYLHPGAPFLRQLSADKATAAYIFVPVFLHSVIEYLHQPHKKNVSVVLLTGLSLMMMHPVMLVFAVMVAGLINLFGLNQANLRARGGLFILLLAIMLPQIALRFVRHEAQAAIPFSSDAIQASGGIETMISRWGATIFYGFNPAILAMHVPYADKLPLPNFILEYGWLVIPLLGAALALKHLRRDPLAQYVLACFILGAVAGIPFTGWLLGYIVSAWMLERTLWIYPFGIGLVCLLIRSTSTLPLSAKIGSRPWQFATLLIFGYAGLGLVMVEQGLPNLARFDANAKRYTAFAQIGEFMDAHTTTLAYAVGSDELNDYIPTIASKVKGISFRPSDPAYPYFYSFDERSQRFLDRRAIISNQTDAALRVELIEKYQIRFLWVKGGEYYLVKGLLAKYPTRFSAHALHGYYLVEVHPPPG